MSKPTERQVLVATDLGDTSPALVAVGADMARRLGAELTVLYVFDPAAYVETIGEALMPLDEYRRTLRGELRDQAEAVGEGLRTWVEVVEGRSVAPEILSAAARVEADLIVIGTHARTGLRRAVLGSVAEQVLRHARVPVMVVPISVLAKGQPALAAS